MSKQEARQYLLSHNRALKEDKKQASETEPFVYSVRSDAETEEQSENADLLEAMSIAIETFTLLHQ